MQFGLNDNSGSSTFDTSKRFFQNSKKFIKKKINISKDSNETKITFFNVKFKNVDLWNVENRSISSLKLAQNEVDS